MAASHSPIGKLQLQVKLPTGWKVFCHPTWDMNLADQMCRSFGFQSAQAEFEGNSSVTNDTCSEYLGFNKTICGDFETLISTTCTELNKATAVCKGIRTVHVEALSVICAAG